jgi:23S rRNA A2030 N6-methylase RlmJ
MEKIMIDPHFCSREEYNELIDYLKEKCWDFKKIKGENK